MATSTIQTGRVNNTSSGMSGKERLVEALKTNATSRGYVKLTTKQLAKQTGLTDHEVVHYIKDSFRGLITCQSNKTGGLSRIKLTPMFLGQPVSKAYKDTPTYHDFIVAKQEGKIGDEFQLQIKDQSQVKPRTTPSKIPNKIPSWISASEKPEKIAPEKIEPLALETPVKVLAEHTNFPVISKLMRRKSQLDAAAKLAEEAGAEDLALAIMERAESPLSAIEMEAISLYKAYLSLKENK